MGKAPKNPSVAQQVNRVVRSLDIRSASPDEVAEAAGRIAALGRGAVAALARGALRRGAGRRETVAALLGALEGEPARWAHVELEALLDARALSPTERVWLTAALRRLGDLASGEHTTDGEALCGAEDLLDDEAELLLWRDELATLAPDEQEAALAPLLQDGNPAFLPLVEMAISLRSPRLDLAIAGALGCFVSPAALPLVRELLRRPDPLVRQRARDALVALERQGVETRNVFVASTGSDEPVAASLATLPDGAGRIATFVARGDAPGRIRYAVVVVDPVEAGILRAWGESGLTQAELHERIAEFDRQAGRELLPLDLNTVQALVAAGEDYARQHGRELPPDYVAWRRCVGAPAGPAELPVVFGPSCSECGRRMRSGDILHGGVVAGRVALCGTCAAKPRTCALCKRLLNRYFDDFLVREGADGAGVELVCLRCARRAGRGRGN